MSGSMTDNSNPFGPDDYNPGELMIILPNCELVPESKYNQLQANCATMPRSSRALATCTFQITDPKGVWQPCGEAASAKPYCARHHALCEEALKRVSAKIASRSVRMYYIGLTHRGLARFHGNKVYDHIEFVAGLRGPTKVGLGPAEAVSLEQFLQDKCKLGDRRGSAYLKYAPEKRDLPYRPSLGTSPMLLPNYSLYLAWSSAPRASVSSPNRRMRTRTYGGVATSTGRLPTMADFVVQFRIGSQLHVDGPDYVPYNKGSLKHNEYFRFKTYAEANKWLRDRVADDPSLLHKLAPETIKRNSSLLTAVGIIPGTSPRVTKPYEDLFDFTVRPIE